MRFRHEVCIIVDAYSTGNTLAGIFSGYGYPSIHIQSGEYIPPLLFNSFKEKDFLRNFVFDGDLDSLCDSIKSAGYTVKCVVPGAECGVELADKLSEKLGLPSNGTEYSSARRDKFLMTEALKRAGVDSVRHFKSSSVTEILEWAKINILPKPVVLKPIASSSTDGFHICHTEIDIITAFNNIISTNDIFGKTNTEVLIQNYLNGQEYCVNMVSRDGIHYLSEIWRVNKRRSGYSKVYDSEFMVLESDAEYSKLVDYANQVLNALKIKYGPSHSEIIITDEGQPILVESAARMMGSIDLSLITEARSSNAALLTAESYLLPHVFMERVTRPRHPARKLPCMVQLLSTRAGVLIDFTLEHLHKLKTFHSMDTFVKPGAQLFLSVDTRSSIGRVFLMGDSNEELQRDYEQIRELERSGLIYTVEVPSHSVTKISLNCLGTGPGLFSTRHTVPCMATTDSAALPGADTISRKLST